MKLEGINCEYIKVSPFAFEQGYNTQTLKELIITGIFNRGTPVTKTISLTNTVHTWQSDLTFTNTMYIKEMYVKNIFTNQLFNLITTPLLITSNNMVVVADMAQTVLRTTLGITLATVAADYITSTTGNFIVTNLPYNLVMDSVVLTLVSVEKVFPFTCTPNADIIVNQDVIYLKPSFFGQTTLSDGIYNITTITVFTDDAAVQEQMCLFVDCLLSAALYSTIDINKCDPHDINILMMHYALSQASNKQCDCDGMYDIYNYLINNINSDITKDCGC